MSFPFRTFYLQCLVPLTPVTIRYAQFFKKYSQAVLKLNMNEALLFYEEGSQTFEMQIRYINPILKMDRQFNYERKVDECLKDFLRKIENSINARLMKKTKRKKNQQVQDTISEESLTCTENGGRINFVKGQSILNGELTCRTILENSADIKLIISDTEYVLRQNVPHVTKIKLPTYILVNYPVYPYVFETKYADERKSVFNWYRKHKDTWIHVADGFLYTPNESDIGCNLKVSCLPKSDTQSGPIVEIVSNIVESGPGTCLFHFRHTYTKNRLFGKSFRVTSYNILANVYSNTSLSKETLYPYCPSHVLSMDYRKPLILKELIGFNSDVICLQEVEDTMYKRDLLPPLRVMNYDGIYNNKNNACEGLAIFYNQDRFEKLTSDHSVIGHNTELGEFNTIWSQIQNNNIKQSFQNKNTIIQIVTLRSKENTEILIIGNTHLYFRPNADHIRLLQAYYGLSYLRSYAKKMRETYPECTVSILYCGDFNSTPENAVYQLMTQKYVPETHEDWKSCPEEYVENVAIQHDLHLSSACGVPEYTHYTATFSGCLDYIFYQTDYLGIEQIIPMPSSKELAIHTGLPSPVCPSDHISLCVDLKWLK